MLENAQDVVAMRMILILVLPTLWWIVLSAIANRVNTKYGPLTFEQSFIWFAVKVALWIGAAWLFGNRLDGLW